MLENYLYLCTMKHKEEQHYKAFQELGINPKNKTYFECVDILIEKYIGVCDALEWTEYDRFSKEIQRIQKPTN